jgi:hypothetical protein
VTRESKTFEALPSVIPVFPLPGAILLPGSSLPLNIFEPRYLRMVRAAIEGHNLIGMIQPKGNAQVTVPELYGVGCVGSIADVQETDDGRILIRLKGLSRFEVAEELGVTTPYRQVRANWEPFKADPWGGTGGEGSVKRDPLLGALKGYLDTKGLDADFDAIASAPDDILVNTLSMIVPLAVQEKQALLEAASVPDRSQLLQNLLEMASADSHGGANPNSPDHRSH